MEWAEKEALRKCRARLCKDLHIVPLLANLESNGIITDFQRQQINAEKTDFEKNGKLIDILTKNGIEAFGSFLSTLSNTQHQQYIAEYLEKACEEVKEDEIPLPNKLDHRQSARESVEDTSIRSNLFDDTQQTLKNVYLQKFKNTNPLSLPFDFDIEKLWVPVVFKLQVKDIDQKYYDDYIDLINESLNTANFLIIEGRPACGKSALMKKIAFDWAKNNEKLSNYDLVLTVEFRNLHGKNFSSISQMVTEGMKVLLDKRITDEVSTILNDSIRVRSTANRKSILVLLDGYDEAFPNNQCKELENLFGPPANVKELSFKVILTTRPEKRIPRFTDQERKLCEIIGFDSKDIRNKYIEMHFCGDKKSQTAVRDKLNKYQNIEKLAATPFFLTCICLVFERLEKGTIVELYDRICWYVVDRYQVNNGTKNIPKLFQFECNLEANLANNLEIIRHYFRDFPLFKKLAKFALFTLTTQERLLLFSRELMLKFELTDDEISVITSVGYLRKELIIQENGVNESFTFFHQTMQEYLAAMHFCYWASDEERKPEHVRGAAFLINCKSNNAFCAEIQSHVAKDQKTSEIEAFIWRIAIQDTTVINNIQKFFEHYKILSLNLSKIDCDKNYSRGLTECLQKCSKLEHLDIDSDSINNISIDLSAIRSVKFLSLHNFTFDVTNNSGVALHEMSSRSLGHLYHIVMSNCKFSSLKSFDHIFEIFRNYYLSALSLETVDIFFDDAVLQSYVRLKFSVLLSRSLQIAFSKQNGCSLKKIIHAVNRARMKNIDFEFHGESHQVPEVSNLVPLVMRSANRVTFTNANFCCPTIFSSVPDSEDPSNLKKITFHRCSFDFPTWSTLISFLSNYCANLTSMIITECNDIYTKEYFSMLTELDCLDELSIGLSEQGYDKNTDWNEILNTLAKDTHLKKLQFSVDSETLVVNEIMIRETGRNRRKIFQFTSETKVKI